MESVGLKGQWLIESENVVTGIKKKYKFDNMIVQGFYTLVNAFFDYDQDGTPTATDMNLNYVALGDDNTAVTRDDSSLYSEQERYIYTTKTPSDEKYVIKRFLATDEGNMTGGYITELGIFANGTTTAGSGTMVSRSIVNVKKNENIKLTLTWTFKGVSA